MHIRIITMRVYKDDGSLSKRLMICLNWFETFESIQSSLSDNLCNFINCTSQILAFEIDDDFYKLRVHYGAHPFCDQILVCNTFVVLATMKKKTVIIDCQISFVQRRLSFIFASLLILLLLFPSF